MWRLRVILGCAAMVAGWNLSTLFSESNKMLRKDVLLYTQISRGRFDRLEQDLRNVDFIQELDLEFGGLDGGSSTSSGNSNRLRDREVLIELVRLSAVDDEAASAVAQLQRLEEEEQEQGDREALDLDLSLNLQQRASAADDDVAAPEDQQESAEASTDEEAARIPNSAGEVSSDLYEEQWASHDFEATARTSEASISFWSFAESQKSVLLWGASKLVNRDQEMYLPTLQRAGWDVQRWKGDGAINNRALSQVRSAMLLCIAPQENCLMPEWAGYIKRYQRINRIPGLRETLWSKDSFCHTIKTASRGDPRFSKYFFDCWVFPREWHDAHAYAVSHPNALFISKPIASYGGIGVKVLDGARDLRRVRTSARMVQPYLSEPYLIGQHKWDLRAFVLVTSMVPLRAYVHSRGIVRFASMEYNEAARNSNQVLTNTNVNKQYVGRNVTSITWSFQDLARQLEADGHDVSGLFAEIRAAISTVLLSAENTWRSYLDSRKALSSSACVNCYQVLGLDLIVDRDLKPRVIEVNAQPSLRLSEDASDHYSQTKQRMVTDTLEMLFGDESPAAGELVDALKGLDLDLLGSLTTRHWEYLVGYFRERRRPGGWISVYPRLELEDYHASFLDHLDSSPGRMALHRVLAHLERAMAERSG